MDEAIYIVFWQYQIGLNHFHESICPMTFDSESLNIGCNGLLISVDGVNYGTLFTMLLYLLSRFWPVKVTIATNIIAIKASKRAYSTRV